MIDIDDVGEAALYGGIPILIIFIVWYLVFSKPEIEECHAKDGVIVRIEGEDLCIDKSALKPAGEKP